MTRKMNAVLALSALVIVMGWYSAAQGQDDFEIGGDEYAMLAAPTTALDVEPATAPVPSTVAATQPEATSAAAGHFPAGGTTFGLEEFISHFAPHEPMYFVGGTKAPNIKFQLSLRYR